MDRVAKVRIKEKEYHLDFYEKNVLFEDGSWLKNPVKTVLESFNSLEKHNNLKILDIGCGVGRNAIPIARELKGTNGKVICLDILDYAITKLKDYSKQYEVLKYIEGIKSSIED